MEATTIKLHRDTKAAIDRLKQGEESYNHAIYRLISQLEKKSLRQELIEGYRRMGSTEMKEFNEWETASSEW